MQPVWCGCRRAGAHVSMQHVWCRGCRRAGAHVSTQPTHPPVALVRVRVRCSLLPTGDSEGVSFKFFLTGILVCCMYQEFINDAEQVFLSLKTDLTGSADHAACEAVLRALAASVRRTSKFTLLGTEHAAVAW